MKYILTAIAIYCVLAVSPSLAQSPVDDSPEIEARVESLLARMTTDEKIDLIGGTERFYTKSVPSIGLPRFRMSDGPVGVRCWGKATAYPASIALAATWDAKLAQRVGEALGNDSRARGVHILLAPGVNIYRSPLNGRNVEYLGEDPWLASRIAVGYIRGLQSKGVSATVKHFAANNSEFDRHNSDSIIDERTLHEIYLPAFEAAVREANVGAVMDSYNLVNGQHATQNKVLNLDILKGSWAFQGILMSDWDATYDGVAATNAGLDLEMPYAKFMSAKTLLPALKNGTVSQATIDDKVRRILRTAIRFGWLDREQENASIPKDSDESAKVALQEAVESITLLKNDGHLLPLDIRRQHHFVLVGPAAEAQIIGGGGSSRVTPFRADSVASGLRDFIGEHGTLQVFPGLPKPEELITKTKLSSCTMTVVEGDTPERTDQGNKPCSLSSWHEDGKYPAEAAAPADKKGHTYYFHATFVPAVSGKYIVAAGRAMGDVTRVQVDGRLIMEQGAADYHPIMAHATLELVKGKPVALGIRYFTHATQPHVGLGILAVEDIFSAEEKKTIANADAVIVAAGLNTTNDRYEAEGNDRPFQMPWGQDELISLTAKLNPRTVVDLQAGGAVDVHPWIDRVPVLVDSWYGGQSVGAALARVLFGESPGGKLPMSWELEAADNPTFSHYYETPGPEHRIPYAEGVFYGYRYYTSMHRQPLFPFGFGLSYTTFAMTGLKLTPDYDHGRSLLVEFDIRNTGNVAGAEVPQVYVGEVSPTVPRPLKELKAFERVELSPGASKHVAVRLDGRAFAYYDVALHGWKTDPGKFQVTVGSSSAEDRLSGSIELR